MLTAQVLAEIHVGTKVRNKAAASDAAFLEVMSGARRRRGS